jgi:hypothetical protein
MSSFFSHLSQAIFVISTLFCPQVSPPRPLAAVSILLRPIKCLPHSFNCQPKNFLHLKLFLPQLKMCLEAV